MTSLPESTIRALENPTQSDLPASNIRGLYETYAESLGVTSRRIRDLAGDNAETAPSFSVKRLPRLKSLIVFSNIGVTVATLTIVIGILGYAGWQGLGLFSSPSLSVEYPDKEYIVVDQSSLEVRGTAPIDASVLVNGQPTTVNVDDGTYSQIVYLQEGYNQVTVEAVNNFSTKSTRSFVVIYDPVTGLSFNH